MPADKPRGRPLAKGNADQFFSWPLQRLNEIIAPAAISLRSLPADRLQAELEQLDALCGERRDLLAERLMLRLYEREKARRGNPLLVMDDDLDEALFRLERQTSEADRQLVRQVGAKLFTLGGVEAMQAAAQRMLERARDGKQDLRRRIIAKRWEGIGAR